MRPDSMVTWATFRGKIGPQLALPPNVREYRQSLEYPTVFSFPDCSFDHIRASSLPAIWPASKIKAVLEDSYRMLARGGILEIRLMNPIPHASAGPELRNWVDTNLILELEKAFISSRPAILIPMWCREIGFSIGEASSSVSVESRGMQQQILLPIVADSPENNVEEKIQCEVGRSLFSHTWGRYISGCPFWEDEIVLKECREKNMSFSCTILYAMKPNR